MLSKDIKYRKEEVWNRLRNTKRKTINTIHKIWQVVTWLLVTAVVLLAIALVGVRVLGYQVYTVLSSSMEPAYHTGSLLYVKQVAPDEIQVGTPITFVLEGDTVATHRVVEVVEAPEEPGVRYYRTKGDANHAVDGGMVHEKNVLGVPRFSIPGLGYVAAYIQSPGGKYVTIAVCTLILLLTFLPDLLFGDKKEENDPQIGNGTLK